MTRACRGIVPVMLLALAACSGTGGLGTPADGLHAPSGVDTHRQAVDGLTVGHRLMEAGQYELAIKAYYRAAAEHGLNVDVLSALGSVNLKLGRLGQAEILLRKAIAADEKFVPAWNNLGVVLMEQGNTGEAERVFRTAVALDNGNSVQIRENLSLALAKLENPAYHPQNNTNFALVRRGSGNYELLSTP